MSSMWPSAQLSMDTRPYAAVQPGPGFTLLPQAGVLSSEDTQSSHAGPGNPCSRTGESGKASSVICPRMHLWHARGCRRMPVHPCLAPRCPFPASSKPPSLGAAHILQLGLEGPRSGSSIRQQTPHTESPLSLDSNLRREPPTPPPGGHAPRRRGRARPIRVPRAPCRPCPRPCFPRPLCCLRGDAVAGSLRGRAAPEAVPRGCPSSRGAGSVRRLQGSGSRVGGEAAMAEGGSRPGPAGNVCAAPSARGDPSWAAGRGSSRGAAGPPAGPGCGGGAPAAPSVLGRRLSQGADPCC